jgi:radical SAM enzyme (TIGR01210 family)
MSEKTFLNQENIQSPLVLPEKIAAEFKDKIERIANMSDSDFIITARGLLRTAMISLRHEFGAISGEKTVSHLLPDPFNPQRENPLVVLGTGRCSYMEMGGCSMCSFGESAQRDISNKEIDAALDFLRKHNDKYPDKALFNINVIGSFFNDSELKPEKREYILEYIKKYKSDNPDKMAVLVTESRFEDITEAKMANLRKTLGVDVPIEIGFGVESTNNLVREAILGKGLDPKWQEKLRMLKKYDIDFTLHIMFGSPFLNEKEQMADSIQSAKDCLKLTGQNDRVLLMIMNKKPGTLVDALAQEGKYQLPSVALAAETVLRLGEELTGEEFKRISVFGLVFPEEFIKSGAEKVSASSEAEQKIINILEKWRGSAQELAALEQAYIKLNKKNSLAENLPQLDIKRLKTQIISEYVKILAKLYCQKETDLASAKDKLEGILDVSSQMGGSSI